MRLLQFVDNLLTRVACVHDDGRVAPLRRYESVYHLARMAIDHGCTLADIVAGEPLDAPIAYEALLREARLLPPLTHPDPAHCLVSGTGLTHLGSATARDAMHQKLQSTELSDSMKMFKWGVEGGKP